MTEFELTCAKVTAEKEQLNAALQALTKRYESLKTLQANAIKNESVLKTTLTKSQSDLLTSESRFQRLKAHAQEQLDAANAEISRIREESSKKSLLLAAKWNLAQTQLQTLQGEYQVCHSQNIKLHTIISELTDSITSSIQVV